MAPTLRPRRIILLTHSSLVPPDDIALLAEDEYFAMKTECDVWEGLRRHDHDVLRVGLDEELGPLRRAIKSHKPHAVFNLLEEFRSEVLYDAHVVSYLELLKARYTGCSPRGLVIARDKALSKKILTYHRIKVPKFVVIRRKRKPRRPKHLQFPLIVKSLVSEGSEGIAQASVVTNDAALADRVALIHDRIGTDAIVEQFIDGREVYAAVMGNQRMQVLPTWELNLDNLPDGAPRIATSRIKWDAKFQRKHQIRIRRAQDLSADLERHIARTAKRICLRLSLDGYVRIDFRLSADGELYFLEANPNPDIAYGEEFAEAANASGYDYDALLDRVISLAMCRR